MNKELKAIPGTSLHRTGWPNSLALDLVATIHPNAIPQFDDRVKIQVRKHSNTSRLSHWHGLSSVGSRGLLVYRAYRSILHDIDVCEKPCARWKYILEARHKSSSRQTFLDPPTRSIVFKHTFLTEPDNT